MSTRVYTRWTERRRFLLEDLLARGWSDRRIAKVFETTAVAVNAARQRFGMAPRYRQGHSRKALAQLLGVTPHVIHRWQEAGWLGRRYCASSPGGHGVLLTSDSELMDFLENPDTWHAWRWQDITDPNLRLYCRRLRGDVVYLGSAEVAAMAGVLQTTVNRHIQQGKLTVRRDGNLNRIRLEEAERYRDAR